MAFCRFCGKEMVNGQCDCDGFRSSMMGQANSQHGAAGQYGNPMQGGQYGGQTHDGQYGNQYQGGQHGNQYQGGQYGNQYQGGQYGNQYQSDQYGNQYQNGQYGNQYQGSQSQSNQYQQPYEKEKDPFIIPSFKINASSFSSFMSSIRDMTGAGEPNSSGDDPYEHNVPIVPDCIQPEENEIVVKQYNIAKLRTRLKFMKAEGRMMVTNRRILFRAAGTSLTGNILQEHQFNLDQIGGIEMHKDYKFSIMNFIFCILLNVFVLYLLMDAMINIDNGTVVAVVGTLLGIVGLVPTFVVYKRFWLKLTFAFISNICFLVTYEVADNNGFFAVLVILSYVIQLVDLIIVCFVPNLVIKIKTMGAEGAIVIGSQKAMFRRRTGDDYSGFAEVLPWDDTVMAMNEIGTMIDDLQKQGDYAVQKWSA